MRMIRYYVTNKNTGKSVFTHCHQSECINFMNALEHKEDYAITYKWMSI